MNVFEQWKEQLTVEQLIVKYEDDDYEYDIGFDCIICPASERNSGKCDGVGCLRQFKEWAEQECE